MFGFILRRIGIAIPTLLILIIFSFLLMHLAPGGPFTQERALPPQVIANLNAKYGLDEPLWRQLLNYLGSVILHFDFGPSFVYPDRSVNQLIATGFPVTLTYGLLSFALAVFAGVGLGVAAAVRDHRGDLVGALLIAAPRYRVDRERLDELRDACAEAAAGITARLGGTAAPLP